MCEQKSACAFVTGFLRVIVVRKKSLVVCLRLFGLLHVIFVRKNCLCLCDCLDFCVSYVC